MKKKYGIKPILASLLVTASLATPMVVMSEAVLTDIDGEILFEGARLEYKMVGDELTVQAIFDVAVDKVVNGTGATFYLDYNPAYLTPSDMNTNAKLTSGSNAELKTDAFFSVNPGLFRDAAGNSVDPFMNNTDPTNANYYSSVDISNHTIHMDLHLDQSPNGVIAKTIAKGQTTDNVYGSVELLDGVMKNGIEEQGYVLNLWGLPDWDDCEGDAYVEEEYPKEDVKKVVLGQLSFQVEIDRLPEIVKYFGNMTLKDGVDNRAFRDYRDGSGADKPPVVAVTLLDASEPPTTTYLLDIAKSVPANKDPWQVLAYVGTTPSTDNHHHPHAGRVEDGKYAPGQTGWSKNVVERYDFSFPKDMIIRVEATNPELTINSYQNFTDGSMEDLPISLGKYSPMVTVTYADGSKENVPFPWGKAEDGYTPRYTQDSSPVTSGNYDAKGGDYTFYQYYKYTDSNGDPQTFPKPVTAHMTVIPITVVDVTADDLERTYDLQNVTGQVTDVSDLSLPDTAKVITDIVPSGVSITMPIKGWMPADSAATGSAWPVPDTALHSLKADNAVGGVPYWPDGTDLEPVAANHVGTYSFETSDSGHTDPQGILSEDIRKAYPWLTVPEQHTETAARDDDWWDLDHARRHIVAHGDYMDKANYAVSYVSTVTAPGDGNGGGQPTLTLSVRRTDKDISQTAVFRTWLPNGQEIGTGLSKGMDGETLDDWFNSVEAGVPVDHGFYDPGTRESDGGSGYLYNLDYNPDDPDPDPADGDPKHDLDRETLRRYINLGGWYKVAICEDPDKLDPDTPDGWTEQIPVYVPPRRNEYVENKVYNFIGENAALFNWPGTVGDTLYLPRGSYNPVGPLDPALINAQGVGLPLYDKSGTVTDGRSDSTDVFEEGNPMRPKLSRYEESYGLKTIYDGQTGAQPGEIFSVKVDQLDTTHTDPWNGRPAGKTHVTVGGDNVYQYGPTPLYTGPRDAFNNRIDNGYQVMAFGYIHQPTADLTTYKATLRTQLPEKEPSLREHIRLLSDEPTGITRGAYGDPDRVTLATYDTVMEGYTIRQDYTFIIENDGDVDIYGLDIDGLTDGYPKDTVGGRFVMLQPPASFLPAGERTTFTLTYIYDLENNEDYANKHGGQALPTYRDTFYITSTSHPNAVHGGTHQENKAGDGSYDYLLEFDAEFEVSDDPLHKVTVIYKPTNGNMGTAGLIVGEQSDGTDKVMNYTTTTQTFRKDKEVYVVANLVDEYEIKSVTITDNNGNTIVVGGNDLRIYEYTDPAIGGDPTLVKDGTKVYVFTMPDQDVTVTINFYEPLRSKLRLSDLIEYSAPSNDPNDPNDLKTSAEADPPKDPEHTYRVWRKTFTQAERDAAAAWQGSATGGNGADQDLYLMTKGTARPHAAGYPAGGWPDKDSTPADEGRQFLPSENQYIVVIDENFDLSQVEATLRKVVYHEDYQGTDATHTDGYNEDIDVTVQMDVYPYEVEDNWNKTGYTATMVYTPAGSSPIHGYGPRPGKTATPTIHTTRIFAEQNDIEAPWAISPKPGESTYVRISLSALDPENGNNRLYRYYYLEIHRRTKDPKVELRYGNSPYGMIRNESKWSDAAKTAAEEAFVSAGYTFRGATAAVTPDKVTLHRLDRVTYWREAWVRNRGLYEPESFTGQHMETVYTTDKDGNTIVGDYVMVDDPGVYNSKNNLDLDRYAYFALLGEDMREPGVSRAWDSSGREVDVNTISAQAEVTLLDAAGTTQVARFSGTDTAVIDLGVANGQRILANGYAVGATVDGDAWPVASAATGDPAATTYSLIENIRPGRYLIQYTYTDFDGVSKLNYYRPFVILRGVGDVNTDGMRDNGYTKVGSDEYAIEDRVTDPLGYEAGEWDGTKETVYPYANIFKYRVCDVNNDRNINNIDANLVDKNIRKGGDEWLRFYEPVDYGLPAPVPAP